MARRSVIPPSKPAIKTPPVIEAATADGPSTTSIGFWTRPRVAVAVVLLLAVHVVLAVDSLLKENATVDEVAHMPAGVSYWETGTFKLYHHNPPLVKLVAALPVVLSPHDTAPLYRMAFWANESQAAFGQSFAFLNRTNYLELFDRARLMMPLFTVLGGLVVFAWSARLYGAGGGLLSLALWVLCPNILAHGRLVTSDAAAAAIGAGATYLFWRYQGNPTWRRAAFAGLMLGVAQLTKFSLVLLYGLWPALALIRFALEHRPPTLPRNGGQAPGEYTRSQSPISRPMENETAREGWPRRLAVGLGQGALMVALSVLVIDVGYGFEGVGTPIGRLEFASRSLTRPVPPGMARPTSPNPLLDGAWRYRVNRFRGTVAGMVPSPLPKHYLLGFDEQKVETEGIPEYFLNPNAPIDDSKVMGYSVYLDGVMKRSGWWYYYLATLAYKVPEGTLFLVGLSGIVLFASKRSRGPWADEIAVLAIPVGVLGAMSLLTDICLGLRYILPIFPYVFIATGKVVPWASGLTGRWKWSASAVVAGSIAATAAATATIHPDYLAYFNRVSGGPDRGAEHLIDSNLDWGQDLVKLNRWLKIHHPGERVGLAYFGQINPSLLALRGDGFDWFLPPALAGTISPLPGVEPSRRIGPAEHLQPGPYAVSASIVRGLPWRHYDSISLKVPEMAWMPSWNAGTDAFAYFRELTPVARVGHSIYVYEVTHEDCARLAPLWPRPKLGSSAGGRRNGPGPG